MSEDPGAGMGTVSAAAWLADRLPSRQRSPRRQRDRINSYNMTFLLSSFKGDRCPISNDELEEL